MDDQMTMAASVHEFALDEIRKLEKALSELQTLPYLNAISAIVDLVAASIAGRGKILFCGNGGSAADSQHLAAELVGRQNYDRAPAAGISLTVDPCPHGPR